MRRQKGLESNLFLDQRVIHKISVANSPIAKIISMNYEKVPDGFPCMIFSDLNAHWHILSCTLFISLLSRRWRPSWSWIKAAVVATEKAAELPRPAPMGISDVTVISIEGTWSPASLKIATRKKKYVHV